MLPDQIPTSQRAIGKWRGILAALGVDSRALTGKHVPCPKCGGRDRFRFDDKDGRGTWICSKCGAGSGFDLLTLVRGWSFPEAAREVDQIIGSVKAEPVKREMSEAAKVEALRTVWKASRPVELGDVVDAYLRRRGVGLSVYPACLRTCQRLEYREGGQVVGRYPAMLALVSAADGSPATVHRTWLAHDGSGKAPIAQPRKLMPGSVPRGGAIRLAELGPVLGIAEGIETALGAATRFGVPCWSAINSTLLQGWAPPDGATEVIVFGDSDPAFGGQAAAFGLAHRIATSPKPRPVKVEIPPRLGEDWNTGMAA